ncbi:MAG: hypothetical protein AVDCRST_MAG31-1753 [uncultured Sphingomonas sp.]|uniref:Uncharacterized protein n=1 Tax=uncultured Sphingomonas sp. TaxID=158754 RepID=A0A6J4TIY6_9SPHN|nr:MAG: hypothetical protein AVDCRST_MAG31-1753 [uncultured Sphingomonas sp.]
MGLRLRPGGAERAAGYQVALDIEGVVNGGVDGGGAGRMSVSLGRSAHAGSIAWA